MTEFPVPVNIPERKTAISPFRELIQMSPVTFRDRYSLSASIRNFNRPQDVWWTNTDGDDKKIPQTLREGKQGGIMLGVSGGVDSALSHAAISHPELTVLFDTNPHAINYLHYRLEMTRYHDDPSNYLQSIFPGKLDLHALKKAKSRDDLYKLLDGENFLGTSKRMKSNFSKVRAGIARVGDISYLPTGVPIEDVIEQSTSRKHSWVKNATQPDRVQPDWVLYSFLENILSNSDFWLSLKDKKNYTWIKNAYAHGRIKFAQMPLQLLDNNPLFETLKDDSCPPVNTLYMSNANEYISDKDFSRLLGALRSLPGTKDMNVIYSASPPEIAKLGEVGMGIEKAARIRDFPWMADRSPDI